MANEYKHIDMAIDRDNSDEGILQLLQKIRPNWKKEDISFEPLLGGSLNKSFKILYQNDPSTGMVCRVNGPIPEKVGLSRENEVRFLRHFNKANIGVPLIATFKNGLVTKLLSGKTVHPDEMAGPVVTNLTAKYVAQHHHATPTDEPRKAVDGSQCSVISLGKISIRKLKEEVDEETYKSYADQLPFAKIDEELDELAKELEDLNMPVVLSHNDIWQENLMFDKEKETLEFIDYEMCDYNYAAFDIASYMVTQAGMPPCGERMSETSIKNFIKIYLEELLRLDNKDPSSLTDKDIHTYFVHTIKCMQLFNLFNVPYILYLGDYQKRTGGYIYDYVKCVNILYAEYHKLREDTKHLQVPK